jgi:hypothetical protein
MREWTIALLFLALISIQIAVTFADGITQPSEAIDRSKYYDVVIVPKSGPPIVLRARYGQWVGDLNVNDYLENDSLIAPLTTHPPGQYAFSASVTFSDGKIVDQNMYAFSCDGVGQYTLTVTFSTINPSNKWRHIFYLLQVFTTPNDLLQTYDIWNWQPARVFQNRGSTVSGCVNIFRFITAKTGTIRVGIESHSLITDVNNDLVVNILDLFPVAQNYGKKLSGSTDPLWLYDIDCDTFISTADLVEIGWDFGFHVPP